MNTSRSSIEVACITTLLYEEEHQCRVTNWLPFSYILWRFGMAQSSSKRSLSLSQSQTKRQLQQQTQQDRSPPKPRYLHRMRSQTKIRTNIVPSEKTLHRLTVMTNIYRTSCTSYFCCFSCIAFMIASNLTKRNYSIAPGTSMKIPNPDNRKRREQRYGWNSEEEPKPFQF